MTTADYARIATHACRAMWGAPDRQVKLSPAKSDWHAWDFGTPGHGGIVYVGPKLDWVPEQDSLMNPFLNPVLNGVYVYCFEEDCNWAVLLYREEEVRKAAFAKRDKVYAKGLFPTIAALYDCVKGVVER